MKRDVVKRLDVEFSPASGTLTALEAGGQKDQQENPRQLDELPGAGWSGKRDLKFARDKTLTWRRHTPIRLEALRHNGFPPMM